jgi:hypothetical protein
MMENDMEDHVRLLAVLWFWVRGGSGDDDHHQRPKNCGPSRAVLSKKDIEPSIFHFSTHVEASVLEHTQSTSSGRFTYPLTPSRDQPQTPAPQPKHSRRGNRRLFLVH